VSPLLSPLLLPLLLALGWLALSGLANWLAVRGEALQAGAAALLVGWPVLLAGALWAGARAWRAAGGAWLRRAPVLAVGAGVLASAALDVAPHARGWWTLARGGDPLGALRAELAPDGRSLRLQGPLAAGGAQQVRALLAGAPALGLVELASPGGRWAEAEDIARALRERALAVRVVGDCDNACVALFLAGSSRQLAASGRLGLQRSAPVGAVPVWRRWVDGALADAQRRAGLPESFVPRMLFASPAMPWRPGRDELLAAGLLGVPGRPLDVALPQPAPGTAAEHADALATHDLWLALENHQPGTLAEAAARLVAARTAGAADDDAQDAAQRIVEERLPLLLAGASQPLRELYWALLVDELAAVRAHGPAACRAVLRGDAAVRRRLPLPLVERELRWLAEVAAEAAPAPAPRRLSPLEAEVLRRSVGERAPAQLAALRASSGEADCEAALKLLQTVQRLPLGERRLAMRVAFEPR
jgi:hypothetical protein